MITERDRARFREKHVVSKSGCWQWMGSKMAGGYGKFRLNGRLIGAHRASYLLHIGPIPDGLEVCHHCDVTGCVNPSHLFLGTHSDNLRDMVAKNRQKAQFTSESVKGIKNCKAKLSEGQVQEIRQRWIAGGITQKELGAAFGISSVMAGLIVNRKNWTHVA